MKVGYTRKGLLSMTEEEQKALLLEHGVDKIIPEMGRKTAVMSMLPEVLDDGSIICVASLSVVGTTAHRIQKVIDLCRERNVELVSLKEEFSTSSDSELLHCIEVVAEIEKDSSFSKEYIMKGNNANRQKKGRYKIEVTPEMEEILFQYEHGLLKQSEAVEKLGVSSSTFYRMVRDLDITKDKLINKTVLYRMAYANELNEKINGGQ